MISGCRCSPERAWSTIAPISGYIGQTRSLPPWSLGPVPADRALVVERAGRVVAADPRGGRGVVGAVARLVAQRPGDDRRVVLVALDHPGDALDPGRQVARVVAQRALERVALDVRLGDHVQPELVGQVREGRVVGVVRGPHGVEPELLHQDQVGAHRLDRDDPPGDLVEVVAVDPAQVDAPAVDEEVHPADLDAPEADPQLGGLDDLAAGRAERHGQRVERRRLRGPRRDAGELGPERDHPLPRRLERPVELRPGGPVGGIEAAPAVDGHAAHQRAARRVERVRRAGERRRLAARAGRPGRRRAPRPSSRPRTRSRRSRRRPTARACRSSGPRRARRWP